MSTCSTEEVKMIVSESENRTLGKLNDSHMAISKSISNLVGDLKKDFKESSVNASTLHEMFNFFKDQHIKMTEVAEHIRTSDRDRIVGLETWNATHSVETIIMQKNLKEIKDILSRLMWLVVSAVVVALLGLILK